MERGDEHPTNATLHFLQAAVPQCEAERFQCCPAFSSIHICLGCSPATTRTNAAPHRMQV